MPLTADQLFTPVQSGVGTNPTIDPAAGTWFAILLTIASSVGLDTTSWQAGAPERTILAIAAVALSQEDVIISLQAQGGFLDFAAAGTVTSVGLDGVAVTFPVTPDPSIPSQNPDGAPGWLDALGQSYFDTTRLAATYAAGSLAVANTTVGAVNYIAGNYHVGNADTGATYVNVEDFTLPAATPMATSGLVSGVSVGPLTTQIATQTPHGLAAGQVVYFLGVLGVNGINGQFATIVRISNAYVFDISLGTSGAWAGGGVIYPCTLVSMNADIRGVDSNAGIGQVSVTVTQNTGVFVRNMTAWSASNWESNGLYAARCRLKQATRSPNGPADAYEYFALTSQEILAAQTPPVALTNGAIVQATTFANPQTEVVSTVVRSATPASIILGEQVTPGCSQLQITDASLATPIELTTAFAHGLTTGDAVIVTGVLGNLAANGGWTALVTASNKLQLSGSVGSGGYAGGGFLEGGDLGLVDSVIQANAVTDTAKATTESSLAFPITIVAVVVVPQAYVTTYRAAAPAALAALFATYPIGGNIPPGETDGTVPYSAVEGALEIAGVLTIGSATYVRQVTSLTVNGGVVDLTYPTERYVALLAEPSIQVVGV